MIIYVSYKTLIFFNLAIQTLLMSLNKTLLFLLIFPLFLGAQDTIAPQKDLKAPVILKGDTLFYFKNSIQNFPFELRAEEASLRLQRLTSDYNPLTDSLWLQKESEFIKIMYNDNFAIVTTLRDAENDSTTVLKLAKLRLERISNSINKGDGLTTKEWAIRIGYFIVSLIVLIFYIKLINWFFKKINLRLSKVERNFLRKKGTILKYFIPKDTVNIFVFTSNIFRIAVIVVSLIIFAPFMFSFFPWAENVVNLFYGYISKPIKYRTNSINT